MMCRLLGFLWSATINDLLPTIHSRSVTLNFHLPNQMMLVELGWDQGKIQACYEYLRAGLYPVIAKHDTGPERADLTTYLSPSSNHGRAFTKVLALLGEHGPLPALQMVLVHALQGYAHALSQQQFGETQYYGQLYSTALQLKRIAQANITLSVRSIASQLCFAKSFNQYGVQHAYT